MNTSNCIATYDPNLRWSKQTVKITLMQWDYSINVFHVMKNNVVGFDVLRYAIEGYYEDHCNQDGQITLLLLNKEGDELEVDIDEPSEIEEMCVALTIVDREATGG